MNSFLFALVTLFMTFSMFGSFSMQDCKVDLANTWYSKNPDDAANFALTGDKSGIYSDDKKILITTNQDFFGIDCLKIDYQGFISKTITDSSSEFFKFLSSCIGLDFTSVDKSKDAPWLSDFFKHVTGTAELYEADFIDDKKEDVEKYMILIQSQETMETWIYILGKNELERIGVFHLNHLLAPKLNKLFPNLVSLPGNNFIDLAVTMSSAILKWNHNAYHLTIEFQDKFISPGKKPSATITIEKAGAALIEKSSDEQKRVCLLMADLAVRMKGLPFDVSKIDCDQAPTVVEKADKDFAIVEYIFGVKQII